MAGFACLSNDVPHMDVQCVTHRTVPCMTRHSLQEDCFAHFLSGVSHKIVQLIIEDVTRHSAKLFRTFPE